MRVISIKPHLSIWKDCIIINIQHCPEALDSSCKLWSILMLQEPVKGQLFLHNSLLDVGQQPPLVCCVCSPLRLLRWPLCMPWGNISKRGNNAISVQAPQDIHFYLKEISRKKNMKTAHKDIGSKGSSSISESVSSSSSSSSSCSSSRMTIKSSFESEGVDISLWSLIRTSIWTWECEDEELDIWSGINKLQFNLNNIYQMPLTQFHHWELPCTFQIMATPLFPFPFVLDWLGDWNRYKWECSFWHQVKQKKERLEQKIETEYKDGTSFAIIVYRMKES